MRSKTVLLLLCLAGVLARGANAAPIATIVEGESSFMRDASRVALAEGVRLANDDLIDTTAQTKLLRIEFDDGLMLLVAPESRLWIAPKFSADKTAPRAARLYLLHGTVKLTSKGDAIAAAPIASPVFDLKSAGRDTVVSVVGGGGAVFAESGDVQIVERTKAKNGATTAGPALTVKTGEYYARPAADKGKTAPRPDAEFIKRLPRAFLDSLTGDFGPAVMSRFPLGLGSDGIARSPFAGLANTLRFPYDPRPSREYLVRAYTWGSAYAELAETQKGSLAPGMLADIAVLSQDIFTVPVEVLARTESMLTLVGGRVAWDAGVLR